MSNVFGFVHPLLNRDVCDCLESKAVGYALRECMKLRRRIVIIPKRVESGSGGRIGFDV